MDNKCDKMLAGPTRVGSDANDFTENILEIEPLHTLWFFRARERSSPAAVEDGTVVIRKIK